MTNIKYRVFDHKGIYQQSYSAELSGSLDWAIQCANRTKGRVEEVKLSRGEEVVKIVYAVKP